MGLLTNNFEGGAAGANITPGNSGGLSGDAFDEVAAPGASTITYTDVQAPAGKGSRAALITSAPQQQTYLAWLPDDHAQCVLRFYVRFPSPPTAGLGFIRFLNAAGNSTRAMLIAQGNGTLVLHDATGNTVWTSGGSINANTDYRIEMSIQTGGSNGAAVIQVFAGDSLSPIGNLSGSVSGQNFSGGTIALVRVGRNFGGTGTWAPWYLDDIAVETGTLDLLGPSVGAVPLDTPANFDLVATPDTREITASWDPVDDADHYELEVEVDVDESWEPFAALEPSSSPVVLDHTDGVDWGTSYRARVRAIPEDD